MSLTPVSLSLVHRVRDATKPPISGGKSPILVLLHGVGSNERDLFGLAEHLDPRFIVVSARAPLTLGPGQFAWYHVNWTTAGPVGNDEEAESSRRAILVFVREAAAAYDADPERIWLMGFSQGAILSLFVALTEPKTVAGIVPMSGRLLTQALSRRASDEQLSGLPIFAVHGTSDPVLPIADGRAIRDALTALPVDFTYREYPMAHQVSDRSLADIAEWLSNRLDISETP